MILLNHPELVDLSKSLQKYHFRHTVSQLAGLLTAPSLHANTIRIEFLVHLAIINCRGKRRARLQQIQRWFNKDLGKPFVQYQEDPVEDVFISNIATREGNFRIFEGIWESNDYFLQAVIDTLTRNEKFQNLRAQVIEPLIALLRLSDCISERLNLARWYGDESSPQIEVKIEPKLYIGRRARAITFKNNDLLSMGIDRKILDPFILNKNDTDKLQDETIRNSALVKHPLIEFGNELIFALPNAASPAIRSFVLSKFSSFGVQIGRFHGVGASIRL